MGAGAIASMEDSARELEAVAAGDPASLGPVYDRFAPSVLGLALRLVGDRAAAEDVVQETFVAVWRNAGRFDRGRGSASAWILSIAYRRGIDALRRQRPHRIVPLEDVAESVSTPVGGDVFTEVAARLDGERVRTALGTLSDKQRQCIELAYYGGLTQQEIATTIGAPLGTVKSHVRLALSRLGRALAQPDDRSSATAVPVIPPDAAAALADHVSAG